MWQIDITRHYKIWFSKEPNEFLSPENQARFIKACSDNPQIKFSFIYSGTCLNAQAKRDLLDFCNKYAIAPVDFDVIIEKHLKNPEDQKLYHLAKKEIQAKGGNMAGASDCTRLIIPVIEQYGTYSDFDVALYFADLPKIMTVRASVLAQVEFVREAMIDLPCINNECLMVSFDPNDPQRLHPDALAKIKRLQQSVIERYANPRQALTSHPIKGLDIELATDTALFITQFFKANPSADIFAFRQHVLQLDLNEYARVKLGEVNEKGHFDWFSSYKNALEKNPLEYLLWRAQVDPDLQLSTQEILAKKLEILKHNLYVYSVMHISGPTNYHVLAHDSVPAAGFCVRGSQFRASITPEKAWQAVLNAFKDVSLNLNGFVGKIISQNTVQNQQAQSKDNGLELLPPLSDQSWTPLGEALRHKRAAQALDKDRLKACRTSPTLN